LILRVAGQAGDHAAAAAGHGAAAKSNELHRNRATPAGSPSRHPQAFVKMPAESTAELPI